MEPPARRLRPVQVVAVLAVVAAVMVLGDRFDGTPDPGARHEPRAAAAPATTPTPSPTRGPGQADLHGRVTAENAGLDRCTPGADGLASCGTAPVLDGIPRWVNPLPDRAINGYGLRGRVVLLDFFSYSCAPCRRDLVYLEDWQRRYGSAGLQVLGVHTPRWDFERNTANAVRGIADLGITFPVGLDEQSRTFDSFRAPVRPAKYLIDPAGTVRAIWFGPGGYDQLQDQIRLLLYHPGLPLPARGHVIGGYDDAQLTEIGFGWGTTPSAYVGKPWWLVHDRPATYPGSTDVPPGTFALRGTWTMGAQAVTAVRHSRLLVGVAALRAGLVVGGRGTVVVREHGRPPRTIRVVGPPGPVVLFTGHVDLGHPVALDASPGVRLYAVDLR